MSVEAATVAAGTMQEATVSQAVQLLAVALRGTPEFQSLMEAALAINSDDAVQELLRQMRFHQSSLRRGQDNRDDHLTTRRRLQTDLEAHASVQAYRQSEQAVRALFQAVDAVISRAAGVDFAANARRSCCG